MTATLALDLDSSRTLGVQCLLSVLHPMQMPEEEEFVRKSLNGLTFLCQGKIVDAADGDEVVFLCPEFTL